MAKDEQTLTSKDVASVKSVFGDAVEVNEDVHPLVAIITGSEFYDTEVDAMSMAMRLLDAENADQLLAFGSEEGQELTHAGDVLDKPFMLHAVKFNAGDQNPNWPLYAVMEVTWNGEKDTMSCGGMNVCVAAYKMAKEGWLPKMVKITERQKATRSGFHPLNLVAAEAEEATVDGEGVAF